MDGDIDISQIGPVEEYPPRPQYDLGEGPWWLVTTLHAPDWRSLVVSTRQMVTTVVRRGFDRELVLNHIMVGGVRFDFAGGLHCTLGWMDGGPALQCPLLEKTLIADTEEQLLVELVDAFATAWHHYAYVEDEALTPAGQALRHRLLALVAGVSIVPTQ